MNDKNNRNSHQNAPAGASLGRQASEWLVLIESGDASDEDRTRFEAWLAEEPGHREAYVALGETWGRLTAMRERVRAAGDAEPGPEVVISALEGAGGAKRRKPGLSWAVAAAVLVAAVLGGIVFLPGDSAMPYRTDVGERRTVSLADGSTVELNTDTELLVEYADEQRWVAMTRGEAFFEVAEEGDRPFVVTAGHGAIRAVGTGFAVRLKSPELVSVMVTEGSVEVLHPAGGQSATAELVDPAEAPLVRRGQQAEYDRDATRIEEITPGELERIQAWRRGLLVFEDASLAEVVSEVNRYTETRIVIVDPAIGNLRLGGTFKTGRLDALLEVLEQGFGIQVKRTHPHTIELHATSTRSARPSS